MNRVLTSPITLFILVCLVIIGTALCWRPPKPVDVVPTQTPTLIATVTYTPTLPLLIVPTSTMTPTSTVVATSTVTVEPALTIMVEPTETPAVPVELPRAGG